MSDDSKPCPVCGETIKAAAIKCRFCNTDLSEYETAKEAEVERQLFTGNPAVISSLGQWAIVVITIGIAWLVYWVRSRSVVYTLTTQRIQIERGLLSTIRSSVELFRIDDFDIHRPLSREKSASRSFPPRSGGRLRNRRPRKYWRPWGEATPRRK